LCEFELVLSAVLFQRRNRVFLSQQINEQFFSACLFSEVNIASIVSLISALVMIFLFLSEFKELIAQFLTNALVMHRWMLWAPTFKKKI